MKTIRCGVLLLALLLVVAASLPAIGRATAPDKTVLILHSYHQGYEWTDGQAAGIAETLAASVPNAEQVVYYLDWKRHPEPAGLDFLEALIRHRHPKGSINAIVTTDDAALSFGLRLRDAIYGPVPLVHGGVLAGTARSMTAGEPNVAGVDEAKDFVGTVRMAMAADPGLKRIYLVRDQTESGQGLEAEFRDGLAAGHFPPHLEWHFLTDLPFDRLEERLATLPPGSAVLLGTYATDINGLVLPPERFLELMSERSGAPIYGLQEYLMGHGLTGGSLLSGREHGRAVGALAASVLDGIRVADLPAAPHPSVVRAIDYREARRHGLSPDRIPEVDRVLNKPFSFLGVYWPLVTTVGGVIAVLAGMVVALSFALRERRFAEVALLRTNEALGESRRELEANLAELTASKEALRERERRIRLVAEASRDIIWTWDIATDRRVLSGRIEELLGVDALSIDSQEAWFRLVHPDDRESAAEALSRHLSGATPEYRSEYRVRHRDGYYLWIYATGKALFDEQGRPTIMAGSYTNVTAARQQQEWLDHLAHFDPLTGLPNRLKLEQHVDGLIKADKASGQVQPLALLFIDMDNFKFVNDSFGHKAGDELLMAFGLRIKTVTGDGLFISRLGGDEFVVVVHGADADEPSVVASRLEQGLTAPFVVEGQHFFITSSVGIARFPWDGRCFDELLQNADTAMYWAKDSGRGRVCAFAPEMNRNVVERVRMLSRVRQALDRNAFSLHYQPQVATADGTVRGFEALVRWTDGELGPVSPARFIPVCEESGLIIPLGAWVLETACLEAASLAARGIDATMSVNVSVVQLAQHDFVPRVLDVLERTGLIPNRLELEITESQMIGSLDNAIGKLNELRRAGIHIALDDFGTGYSSLTYLRTLPIHTLKLDKAFIDDVHRRPDARSLVSSIARIARDLSRTVVAEGVEDVEQWEALSRIGCDLIQGYFISRPLAVDRIGAFMTAWEARRTNLPLVSRADVVVGMPGRG
ncbi:GGDEF and EAL domain-containing protein [Azospirillum sp. TSO35-2]|uniref:GGDEF and EAL domain-containing protein n=1 Tax=Azospirillum sp. TSO35-2 TaxID=716796 RepID=UPI000D614668|nr:GGDEF and EAL domain-containing protein [Azospirillum sp. TSO35-2]PWC31013.1 diguanylate cyclase [Azospirillum sp. TSO35-2]